MRNFLSFALVAMALGACADLSKTSNPDGPVKAPVAAVPFN